jgi:hypothetical protein
VTDTHSEQSVRIAFGDFLVFLQAKGFTIGVDQHLRLQQLLARIAGECRPEELKTLLCPLFAGSRDRQREFYSAFDQFFAILPRPEMVIPKPHDPTAVPTMTIQVITPIKRAAAPSPPSDWVIDHRWQLRALALIAPLLAFAWWALWRWWRRRPVIEKARFTRLRAGCGADRETISSSWICRGRLTRRSRRVAIRAFAIAAPAARPNIWS